MKRLAILLLCLANISSLLYGNKCKGAKSSLVEDELIRMVMVGARSSSGIGSSGLPNLLELIEDKCAEENEDNVTITRNLFNFIYQVDFSNLGGNVLTGRISSRNVSVYDCNSKELLNSERINNFVTPTHRDVVFVNCNEPLPFEEIETITENGEIYEPFSKLTTKILDDCTIEHTRTTGVFNVLNDGTRYNVYEIQEVFIQIDNTAPTFTQIPATATIKCSDYPDDQMINQVTAQDDCGTVTVSFTDSRQPDCSQTTTITRTWTATDACGQSTTAQTVITVLPDEEQPPASNCEAVELFNISLINQLVIDKVFAPNAILTVFKVSDFGHLRFVWSCSTDCFPQNLLTLERGDYRVNIRFYDENWRSICETDKEIFIGEGEGGDDGGGNNGNDGTTTEICNGVKITATNKYISINGFGGDGVETKVFDANWNPVFSCAIGECADPIQIDNVSAGKHFIIFKRYKVGEFGSLTLVCDELVEVTVGGGTIAPLVAAETEKQLPKLKDFQISPNPANDYLYLGLRKYRGEAVNIQVYDQLGNPVLEHEIEEVKDDLEYISLHDFDNGVYFIKIDNPRYRAVTQRVVIARMY